MDATNFKGANTIFGPPKGQTEDEVQSIYGYVGQYTDGRPVTVVCFRPTREELATMLETGRLWLSISGHGMPPVLITAECPFDEVVEPD